MLGSVLVANRGEVARRIIRTLRHMGIRSVAVYSDADRGAPHVLAADDAVRLGPAPAAQSYLHLERVLDAAQATGCDGLHPGYGFLSEQAALAEGCAARGITFVGPPPAALRAMGDKIEARRTVAAAGVRVLAGGGAAGMGDDELAHVARDVGFPVLLKPSAGGGGKGMRVVHAEGELAEAIAAARREARGAFGDDALLVERYVTRPRHLEVQVLADAHGGLLHLGERECTLQRRHQKVVEEAPSPWLPPDVRAELVQQALAAAHAVDYRSAGTVEFVVHGDDPHDFAFIEMNTRLQVEHGVTEAVWGVDLVEAQVRIAAGEALPWQQGDLHPHGHAIEARVSAEDPARGFLPTGGRVLALHEPTGPGVRVDSGLRAGLVVGTDYDPLLAKVIVHAADRGEALRGLDVALSRTVILGVRTNVAFLRALLAQPDVQAGVLDTGLVERVAPDLVPSPEEQPPAAVQRAAHLAAARPAHPDDPWSALVGWRHGCDAVDPGTWPAPDAVLVDGERFTTAVEGSRAWVGRGGGTWVVAVEPEEAEARGVGAGSAGPVRSPMPGLVVDVRVAPGDLVRRGDALVVVEAMKMEHVVRAPADGRVAEVPVAKGRQVRLDDVLVHLEPQEDR